MASIKIVLRKNMIRKDGTIPLAIRISENYKTNYTWLGQYILEKDWDKDLSILRKSHPNYKKLNNFLLKKLTEANDLYFDSKEALTTIEAKEKLQRKKSSKTFFELAAERIQMKYDSGVFSVAKSELSILYNMIEFINLKKSVSKSLVIEQISKRRKERISKSRKKERSFEDCMDYFRNNKKIKFREIDQTFLKNYKHFCKVYLNQKNRTITNQLIFIRSLFNQAIKEGYIESNMYPFSGDKEVIRISSGNKIGLNKEEIEKIEEIPLEENSSGWHAKNVWLVAFYFAGIRISDILKLNWADIKNERLYYVMNKNEKALSLKIPKKAELILEKYSHYRIDNRGYIFPFLNDADFSNSEDVFVKTRNATKLINKYLKRIAKDCRIEKNLSNHIARHSFGNIAGDKIHPLMLQKLYRHSDLKTTLNYQANFIHRDADEALDKVVDF